MAKAKTSKKYSFINELHDGLLKVAETSKNGIVKIKRTELKKLIESTFTNGAKAAAKGERVRFPVIGALVKKDVPARKAKPGVNPFTGQPMMIKARKESKKPRWSFPKATKNLFADKKNW